jgi:hypothetical protein
MRYALLRAPPPSGATAPREARSRGDEEDHRRGRRGGGPELHLELVGRRRRGRWRRGGRRWRGRLGVVTPLGVRGRPGRGTPPEEHATVPEPVRTLCLAAKTVCHCRSLEREARRGDWRVREGKGEGRPPREASSQSLSRRQNRERTGREVRQRWEQGLPSSPRRSVRPPPQEPVGLLDAGGVLRDQAAWGSVSCSSSGAWSGEQVLRRRCGGAWARDRRRSG